MRLISSSRIEIEKLLFCWSSCVIIFPVPSRSVCNAWGKSTFQEIMALPTKLKTVITRERFYKTAAVIFFHGEDGSAQVLRDTIKSLYYKNWDFEHIRVIYPQAPEIPYTVEAGQLKNVWFDRKTYSPTGPELRDSLEGSCRLVRQLVNDLVTSGTNKNRIILGGVDMGAQLAMHVGYR